MSCEGVIGGSGSGSDPRQNGDPSVAGSPSASTLLRLTEEQHRRTLSALLDHFLGADADDVLGAVDPIYSIIPEDTAALDISGLVGSTFSRMAQTVGELHIRGYFDVAVAVGDAIAFNASRRQAVFGECIESPGNDHRVCVDAFLDDFGLWILRRPLLDEERSFFIDTVFADDGRDYAATPEALRDLLVALLSSPNFLYFINMEGEDLGGGVFELDAYELASRLSYHFWNSMPDQELFDAAADGSLMTESGYTEQVERVYADPRTAETFRRFVYEWLELHAVDDASSGVTDGDIQKMTFIDGYDVSPELRENMIEEVLEMAEYYRESGTFKDLFTSDGSFARTEDLAAIYDVPIWSGEGPPEPFPTPERVGLLGRAALLTSATVATHPILRGVRIRENFMCDALGTPPANVNEFEQEVAAVATTREQVESLTSPGSCSGCHSLINGLGFPLEAFDALGRLRSEEMFIDTEGNISMLPLDLSSTPYINGAQDSASVVGPAELTEELLSSGKLEECFARHYVRFTFGLSADPAFGGDQSTVDVMASEIEANAPLGDVFKSIAYSPAFRRRLQGGDF